MKPLTTAFAILALTITISSCDNALTELDWNENDATEEIVVAPSEIEIGWDNNKVPTGGEFSANGYNITPYWFWMKPTKGKVLIDKLVFDDEGTGPLQDIEEFRFECNYKRYPVKLDYFSKKLTIEGPIWLSPQDPSLCDVYIKAAIDAKGGTHNLVLNKEESLVSADNVVWERMESGQFIIKSHLIGNFDIEGVEDFLQAQEATDIPIGMFSLFLDSNEGATLTELRMNLLGDEDSVQDLRLYIKNRDDTLTELGSHIEENGVNRYLSFYGALNMNKGSHTTFQIRGNINCAPEEYLRFRIRLKDVVLIGNTYGFNLDWKWQLGLDTEGSAIENYYSETDLGLRILFSGFECTEPDPTP